MHLRAVPPKNPSTVSHQWWVLFLGHELTCALASSLVQAEHTPAAREILQTEKIVCLEWEPQAREGPREEGTIREAPTLCCRKTDGLPVRHKGEAKKNIRELEGLVSKVKLANKGCTVSVICKMRTSRARLYQRKSFLGPRKHPGQSPGCKDYFVCLRN